MLVDHQDKFEYLKMGNSPDIDRISDKEQFKETIQAMIVLGFSTLQVSKMNSLKYCKCFRLLGITFCIFLYCR